MDKEVLIEKLRQSKKGKEKLNQVLDELYPPDDAKEIKRIISIYFGRKLSESFDELATEKGWTQDTYNNWLKEHFRYAYKTS